MIPTLSVQYCLETLKMTGKNADFQKQSFKYSVQFMQVTNQMYMEILEANPHRYPQWLKYRKVAKPVALISIELLYIASLIQGYLHFMLYTLLACVLLAFLVLKRKNQERQENTVFKILKNLTKTKISEIFLTEEECVICWNKYEEDAEIVKLTCNEKHYFHAQCIEDWIKGGKNTCPLCRQPIDKDVAV
eukprot:403334302